MKMRNRTVLTLVLHLLVIFDGLAFAPPSFHHHTSNTESLKNSPSPTRLNIFDQLRKSFEQLGSPQNNNIINPRNDYDERITECLSILNAAANTKGEDPEKVVTALEDLEKLMRQKCKAETPTAAESVLKNLNGSWRLVFTTGTKTTQDRIQKTVNYFPIKAVVSTIISRRSGGEIPHGS